MEIFIIRIYFEEGFDRLADAICTEGLEGRNLCIVTDTHVEPLYAEEVKRVLYAGCIQKSLSLSLRQVRETRTLNTGADSLYKVLIENQT